MNRTMRLLYDKIVDLHPVHYAMASDNGRDCARHLSDLVASSNITPSTISRVNLIDFSNLNFLPAKSRIQRQA
jgi:hypothetical protein